MANNRTSIQPIPNDFSAILHSNFQQLNSLPNFNIDFLDQDQDWYLLSFLREQQRNGHTFEITFAGLNAIVGALSDQSYFHNPFINNIGFLNQNHHLIGESASNKSSICQEVSLALQSVIELFPGRYSSMKHDENISTNGDDQNNNNANKVKHKSNTEEYSLLVSNITEVGLVNNLSKVNTIILHPDGDVALQKLGYYEQGKNDASGGVSLFCDASDGIRGTFIRGTGVSQKTINRPVALLNMFIASTGSKLASMLQRFHETRSQDGVYGRVFFTWCPGISELPDAKSKCFTNIPSFSHFAYAVGTLFTNEFEFLYSAHESDFMAMNTQDGQLEERLMQEREKQNVTTPATYSVAFNNVNIRSCDIGDDQNDNDGEISSFKLLKTLLTDWWKSSNCAEIHLKGVHRKVVNMLSKCIWSMKVIRIIFRLLSNNLEHIDQKQGDRSTSNKACIDLLFQQAIQTSIQNYLSTECQQTQKSKWKMWSNNNDIIVGYNWYSRKMLVGETLLTLKELPDIVAQRIGKKTPGKTSEEIKLEKAMMKVMNFSVVFFTRQYLTNNKQGEGSGLFSHSYDLKPDQILSPLIEKGLLVGGNFIKNGRYKKEDLLQFPSFRKQLPSVIQNNRVIKDAFESLGLNMTHYETTFEYQRLPLSMEFTQEAIDFMKSNDEFVHYYHNYYKKDRHFRAFREMVDERVRLGQVLRNEDKLYSGGDVIVNSRQKENNRSQNIFELNNTPSSSTMVTTSVATKSYSIRTSCEKNPAPTIGSILSSNDSQVQTTDQEAAVNHQQHNTIIIDNRVEQEPCILMSSNSMEDTDSNTQTNIIHKSNTKDFNNNIFMDRTQNFESDQLESLFATIRSQNQNLVHHRSSSPVVPTAPAAMASSIVIDASSTSASTKGQLPIDLEHMFDDYQLDSDMMVDKQGEDSVDDNLMSNAEERSTNETSFLRINALNNATNSTETSLTDSDGQDLSKTKRRGRPSSTNSTPQKWSREEVDDLIINPKSSSIWKSIILKRQFILGTSTDLFKMIPCRLFDEASRLKLIDFLILKKLLVQDNWFCDAKGKLIGGYLKGSPADPDLAMSLADFGINIEEYKRSLNPNQNDKRRIDGKMINKSCLFSNLLQERIKEDQWFKDNLEIDENSIYVTNKLLQTTSNYQVDQFQQQQKDKIKRTMENKRKRTEELQRESAIICGTDVPVKRKRKPKVRED